MPWLKQTADKVSAAAKELFKDEVREWRELCAAMDLEEQRLMKENQQRLESCPVLCLFWWQNIVGLTCESPVRTAYHSLCCAGCYVLAPPCYLCRPDPLAARCAEHHADIVSEYFHLLQRVLCLNVCNPRQVPLYAKDYRIIRPPRPRGAWSDDKSTGADA